MFGNKEKMWKCEKAQMHKIHNNIIEVCKNKMHKCDSVKMWKCVKKKNTDVKMWECEKVNYVINKRVCKYHRITKSQIHSIKMWNTTKK